MAMVAFADEYRPSMTRFLNRFSNHAKKEYGTDEILLLKTIFEHFLDAVAHLNTAAFQLADRFSVGVFESAFVGRCGHMWEQKKTGPVAKVAAAQLREMTEKIRVFLQEGTTKRENVLERLKIARRYLGPQR
jgi:hypothetical protein